MFVQALVLRIHPNSPIIAVLYVLVIVKRKGRNKAKWALGHNFFHTSYVLKFCKNRHFPGNGCFINGLGLHFLPRSLLPWYRKKKYFSKITVTEVNLSRSTTVEGSNQKYNIAKDTSLTFLYTLRNFRKSFRYWNLFDSKIYFIEKISWFELRF